MPNDQNQIDRDSAEFLQGLHNQLERDTDAHIKEFQNRLESDTAEFLKEFQNQLEAELAEHRNGLERYAAELYSLSKFRRKVDQSFENCWNTPTGNIFT